MGALAMPSTSKKKNGYEQWEIESKADTVIEAEKIKKDTKLFTLVKAELRKRKKALNNIV